MNSKELARDIIAVLIVLGAIASLFWAVNEAGASLLRFLSGAVIGYYFGVQQMPLGGVIKRKKK